MRKFKGAGKPIHSTEYGVDTYKLYNQGQFDTLKTHMYQYLAVAGDSEERLKVRTDNIRSFITNFNGLHKTSRFPGNGSQIDNEYGAAIARITTAVYERVLEDTEPTSERQAEKGALLHLEASPLTRRIATDALRVALQEIESEHASVPNRRAESSARFGV